MISDGMLTGDLCWKVMDACQIHTAVLVHIANHADHELSCYNIWTVVLDPVSCISLGYSLEE